MTEASLHTPAAARGVPVKPLEGVSSFSLRHRLLRAAFTVTWLLLARWTPPPLHRWRALVLRVFGARIHPTARVYGSTRIWYPPNLTMGRHSSLGPDATCYAMDRIDLADYATVSQGAYLCGGTHLVDDPDFTLITRPIRLERYAWVAAQAFVGPGVTLGEGAVLGARSVTMRDLQPWSVNAGQPARHLRDRRRELFPTAR